MEDSKSCFGTFIKVADEKLHKLEENMEFFLGTDLILKVIEVKSLLDSKTLKELHKIDNEKTKIYPITVSNKIADCSKIDSGCECKLFFFCCCLNTKFQIKKGDLIYEKCNYLKFDLSTSKISNRDFVSTKYFFHFILGF